MFKNKRTNRIIVIIAALAMVAGTLAASFGATYQDKLKEAEAAAKKAAAATKNFEQAEKRAKEVSDSIEVTKANIAKSKKDIKKKEADIDKQEGALNSRLTAMYKTGTVGYVDVILSSEDITDLISNIGMVQKILENDQDLLKKLQKQLKKLEKMKRKLEQEQIALEAQEVELKELQKKYKKEAEEWKAKEEALNAEAARLASIAAGNSGNALDVLKKIGNLEKGCAWPTVTHYISSEYGYRTHPIYGDRRFHNGIDIAGRHNDPIYAATAGVVDTASNGWNGGYGNMVIIIGEKYTTLYGHLNSIACRAGQVVRPGQLIGYMGTTGSSTGDHLHFTVFLTGTETTINPHSIIGY